MLTSNVLVIVDNLEFSRDCCEEYAGYVWQGQSSDWFFQDELHKFVEHFTCWTSIGTATTSGKWE